MSAIPAPAPPRAVTYPSAVTATLPNGLSVAVVEQHHLPLVAAQLVLRKGAADGDPGVAAVTAAALPYGSRRSSALDIAQRCDRLGANLSASTAYDGVSVVVSSLSPHFPAALDVLAEIAREPAFDEAEIERVRARAMSDLQLTLCTPGSLARLGLSRVLYGALPYGLPISGSPETLTAIGRDALVRFHALAFHPEEALLIVVGDITPDAAFELAGRAFGDWPAGMPGAAAAMPGDNHALPPRTVVIDMPNAGRTGIAVGTIALARSSPEYYAGVVATAVLSGYSGRLNTEVRVKRGLSYGAGAVLQARRLPGPFVATTLVDNAKALDGTLVMLDTLRRFAGEEVGEDELVPRRAVVCGNFDRSLETVIGTVGTFAELGLHALPLAEINEYARRVNATGAGAVKRFADEVIAGRGLSVVLAGDARLFYEKFAERFPQAERIPAERFALTGPELTKG
jgi:zinc protease